MENDTRIWSPVGLETEIERLEDNLSKASPGRWYRTHGVVVATDGDAVALTDPETLNRHSVGYPGNPKYEHANARLICDAHNALPRLLRTLRVMLEVPEARAHLRAIRDRESK